MMTSPSSGPSCSATSRSTSAPRRLRPAFEDLRIPDPTLAPELRSGFEAAVGAEHVSTDPLDRLVHARGKSLRDLVRHRRGEIGRLPDVVVRPGAEEEVT